MMAFHVKKRIKLQPHHRPSGTFSDAASGKRSRPVATLSIGYSTKDETYYLLHHDARGNELTDTGHSSLDDAMAQAEREFRVIPEDWESVH